MEAFIRGLSRFCWFVRTLFHYFVGNWYVSQFVTLIYFHGDINSLIRVTHEIYKHWSITSNGDSTKYIIYFWVSIQYVIEYHFFFRSDQLRKEAGILFGMKFEDTLFSTLKKDLEIIRENKDLVSVSPIIQSLKICYYQGCTIINLSHRPSNFTNMLFKSMKKKTSCQFDNIYSVHLNIVKICLYNIKKIN